MFGLLLSAASWCAPAPRSVHLTARSAIRAEMVRQDDRSEAAAVPALAPAYGWYGWNFNEPLPAGWWHVGLRVGPTVGREDAQCLQFGSPNTPGMDLRTFAAKQFEWTTHGLWLYAARPVKWVNVVKWAGTARATAPIGWIDLEQATPSLTTNDAILLDLLRAGDSVTLPEPLPCGNYELYSNPRREGEFSWEEDKGSSKARPISRREGCFYVESALRSLTLQTTDKTEGCVLIHYPPFPPADIPAPPARPRYPATDEEKVTAQRLELIGPHAIGEKPSLTLLPWALRSAFVTSWDDGYEQDMRVAVVLRDLGLKGTFFINANSPMVKLARQLEAQGMEVAAHTWSHPHLSRCTPERCWLECAGIRDLLEQRTGHPIISFAYPFGDSVAYDLEGDYVLRALRNAGYWSARWTDTNTFNISSPTDPLQYGVDAEVREAPALIEARWREALRTEGSVFHLWGHSWTVSDWLRFSSLMSGFARRSDVWYATQGEVFVWRWLRNRTTVELLEDTQQRQIVRVSHPWLHPALAKTPLTLKLPEGATRVLCGTVELGITNQTVVLPPTSN